MSTNSVIKKKAYKEYQTFKLYLNQVVNLSNENYFRALNRGFGLIWLTDFRQLCGLLMLWVDESEKYLENLRLPFNEISRDFNNQNLNCFPQVRP